MTDIVTDAIDRMINELNERVEEQCQSMVDSTDPSHQHCLRMERNRMEIKHNTDPDDSEFYHIVIGEPLPTFWCDLPATNLHPNWYL